MSSPPRTPDHGAARVVICDYDTKLRTVTGVLRLDGHLLFLAYDGGAALSLCRYMPDVNLLVVGDEGSDLKTVLLVQHIREIRPGLPVLQIGNAPVPGMPPDVSTLPETCSAEALVAAVRGLVRAYQPSHREP